LVNISELQIGDKLYHVDKHVINNGVQYFPYNPDSLNIANEVKYIYEYLDHQYPTYFNDMFAFTICLLNCQLYTQYGMRKYIYDVKDTIIDEDSEVSRCKLHSDIMPCHVGDYYLYFINHYYRQKTGGGSSFIQLIADYLELVKHQYIDHTLFYKKLSFQIECDQLGKNYLIYNVLVNSIKLVLKTPSEYIEAHQKLRIPASEINKCISNIVKHCADHNLSYKIDMRPFEIINDIYANFMLK
jgi:hypothetical protein